MFCCRMQDAYEIMQEMQAPFTQVNVASSQCQTLAAVDKLNGDTYRWANRFMWLFNKFWLTQYITNLPHVKQSVDKIPDSLITRRSEVMLSA